MVCLFIILNIFTLQTSYMCNLMNLRPVVTTVALSMLGYDSTHLEDNR